MKPTAIAIALTLAAAPPAPGAAQSVDLTGLGYDKGSPNAPVFIIEFGDFGCSACAQFASETMSAVQREFISTGIVRWKYVPFTLGSFPNSDAATRAGECAADQDAFWSMHDLLYARQKDWNRLRDPGATFEKLAVEIGLDARRFRQCYELDPRRDRIAASNAAARDLLIRGTPTFFVNGRRVMGALPITEWRKIIALVTGG
ncbi:MAG: DsbA family protein [Gemmatimonadetes bacterium]|nr:DsbA family protein [Gemmatimonadota bacterium]